MCGVVLIGTHEENFWSKVQMPSEPDGCWEWTGGRDANGYGEYAVKNRRLQKRQRAHQWSLHFYGLNLSKGETIHHVCQNKACVNPDHLEVLTRAEHTRRHNGEVCKRGHSRADNFWIRNDGQIGHCKECQRIRERERRESGSDLRLR